jgi:hypothetical protein
VTHLVLHSLERSSGLEHDRGVGPAEVVQTIVPRAGELTRAVEVALVLRPSPRVDGGVRRLAHDPREDQVPRETRKRHFAGLVPLAVSDVDRRLAVERKVQVPDDDASYLGGAESPIQLECERRPRLVTRGLLEDGPDLLAAGPAQPARRPRRALGARAYAAGRRSASRSPRTNARLITNLRIWQDSVAPAGYL